VALAAKSRGREGDRRAAAAQPAWGATQFLSGRDGSCSGLELVKKDMTGSPDLLSREHGKTFADATGDIQRGLEVVEFACGIQHLLRASYPTATGPVIDLYSLRSARGVAGITPCQLHGHDSMWKFSHGASLRQRLSSSSLGARSVRCQCGSAH